MQKLTTSFSPVWAHGAGSAGSDVGSKLAASPDGKHVWIGAGLYPPFAGFHGIRVDNTSVDLAHYVE